MRKIKLYASVALATLLAACSNDDFISSQPAQTDETRPMAQVALTFDENGPSTRLAWEQPEGQGWQWTFTDGDKIGALLMDDWNQTGYEITDFTFIDYVHTNYPFTRQTVNGVTSWNTPEDAAVCAGNYFFYFPYDKTFTYRGLVGWSVDPVQKNYNEETGEYDYWQAVKDNQKYLGYSFVEPTNTGISTVNFDFVPLFATPAFDITNLTGMALQIERLVIRDGSNSEQGSIDLGASSKLLATSIMLAPKTGNFMEVAPEWENNDYAWHTSQMWQHAQRYTNVDFAYPSAKEMKITPTGKVLSFNGEVTDREATYQYTAEFGDNYIVGAGEHIRAILVMPGGEYSDEGQIFEALLYVKNPNNGDRYVVRIGLGDPQTAGGTNTSAWDDVASAGAENFLKPGIISKYQAYFDAAALQSYNITDFKVTNSEELLWLLEEAAENGLTKLNVTTMGNKVEMTEAVYNELAAHPNYRLYINGAITLPEGCKEDGINFLNFDDSNIKTILTIDSKQVSTKDLTNCEITVTENGELDTKTNDVAIEALITNNGVVVASDVKGDVTNNGTFTADTVDGTVTNNGELVITESVTTVSSNGTATTAGQLGDFTNYDGGMWIVNGDLTINNSVNNDQGATMIVNDDVTVETTSNVKLFTNNGTINNYGTINKLFINYGTVNNGSADDKEATLYVDNNAGAGIINTYGDIEAISNNVGYINVLEGTAYIKFTAYSDGSGYIENTLHGDIRNIGNQHVIYTATTQDFETVLSEMKTYGKYTDLVIAGEYLLKNNTKVSQSTTSATVNNITIAANAKVDIDYNATVQLGGEYISLTNEGLLNINHGAALTAGAVTNNGQIKKNNHATFTYTDLTGTAVEKFDE